MNVQTTVLGLMLLVSGGDLASQEVEQDSVRATLDGDSAALDGDSAAVDSIGDTATAEPVATDTLTIVISRAVEILDELHQLSDSLIVLETLLLDGAREEIELGRVRAVVHIDRVHTLQVQLLELIPALQDLGIPTDSVRAVFAESLTSEFDLYQRGIDRFADQRSELRAMRTDATTEELPNIDGRLETSEARTDVLLEAQAMTLTGAEEIGLDVDDEWEALESFLLERAGSLVGRLQLAVDERARMRARIRDSTRSGTAETELAPMRSRLQIVSQRVSARADNLTAISQLLEQRGIETSPYRQFVIRATGQVTSDILDPEVLMGLAQDLAGELTTWLKRRGPTWFVRFLIVVSFVVLFRIVFRFIWWLIRITGRPPMSKLLSDLGGRTVGPMATIVGVLAGLAFIGVNPTHLMAGMGVAGLIVGLALQDSMSNLAAGFFVLVYRPYDVDDVVSAGGVVGKVRAMGLASTTIVTFDNRRMHVPNRKIWQEVIENRSTERVRRAEATVRVGYERDIDRAIEVIHEVLSEYDAILTKPEGSVFVSRWADSWIEITVWGWAANADWWTATTELPRLIRNRFDAEGIEIPFPRRQMVEDDGKPALHNDGSTTPD